MEIKNYFEDNNYVIIKDAISKEMADFLFKYLSLKRKVINQMKMDKVISPFIDYFGTEGDRMIEKSYSCYGDTAMEVVLKTLTPIMEKATNLELYENYSYCRLYYYGAVLPRHIDRFSCEISATMNLGGDPWAIYLDPTGGKKNEGIEINLTPGDMLVYRGSLLEHWRYAFTGSLCGQVFFHYNNKKTENADNNKYDKRPYLGLPTLYIRNE